MKLLKRTQFGNPILRQKARRIKINEIKSETLRDLIDNMRYTLKEKQYGVGLAAPQIGSSVAITILGVKPTPSRPDLQIFDAVVINPVITEYFGEKEPMWEGCISFGSDKCPIFAQTMRFPKIRVRYVDEYAKTHHKTFDGFLAHLLQHEIDHLSGILFVDRVIDTKSFMNISEYNKRIVSKT